MNSINQKQNGDLVKLFETFNKIIPLIVFDHARAGNGFFSRLFDQHQNILSIPFVCYLPFHLEVLFKGERRIKWEKALHYLLNKTDVRYLFNELDDEIKLEYKRLGDNPNFKINRELGKLILSNMLEHIGMVSKKDVFNSLHAAYAIAVDRKIESIKYILMSDQPLHYKAHFNNSIEGYYKNDMESFKDCIFIHLIRDPRANFASLRHQYLKQNNGMYDYSVKGLIKSIVGIFGGVLTWSTYLYIYDYTSSGNQDLTNWRMNSANQFYVIKNEDINTNFIPTMKLLIDFLGAEMCSDWLMDNYTPTSGGEIWKGVGAYNDTYQNLTVNKIKNTLNKQINPIYRFKLNSKLSNDKKEISSSIVGPNKYVTERWKSKLTVSEIKILELLYKNELIQYNYAFLNSEDGLRSKIMQFLCFALPFNGEGISFVWIKSSFSKGFNEILKLFFDLVSLPVFYIMGRLTLIKLFFRR